MARNEHKKVLEQLSEAYQKVIKEETDNEKRRRGGFGDKDDPEWKRQMDNQPPVSDERWEELKNKPRPKKTGRLTQPENEEGEPKRGISGYEHKTDALVAASKEKQKPYVTSYKDDRGERVFDVLDAHGTAVYRTGNKLEAWKWLKSNFDQLK